MLSMRSQVNFRNKYACPIHGVEGEPSCDRCWEQLEALVEDHGGYLAGDRE